MNQNFNVIVIGGGHAGTEAALAAARMGCKTLLLTHNIETLGQMSCNPAIGGIGKTHLVKEIDALGGAMALAADRAGIQFRTLNASKGPAVQATRAQADRVLYKAAIRETLEQQPNLYLFQQAVDDLMIEQDKVTGVITQTGLKFYSQTVVLTAGTFLSGKIHIGLTHYQGGRAGDPPANALGARLKELPFRIGRLKTGTPPRLDGKTIDFAQLSEQPGDKPCPVMSYLGDETMHPRQVSCFITHTNEKTHDIIRNHLGQSPMYTGVIAGVGPRYCPSIEDKIVRFAHRSAHQIFLEPEGLNTTEFYPNGVSTSLPFEAQEAFIHSIKGLEYCHILRPGYAIEYDFFDPRDLKRSLETKAIAGLFFAGQINGTTGYEEAAGQGIVAGINAAQYARNADPWLPSRDDTYLGVLIDDLTTKGVQEPYRMFTSRAEYRLLLRQDNADLRLTETGRKLGCVSESRWSAFCRKRDAIDREYARISKICLQPNSAPGREFSAYFDQPLGRDYLLVDLLKRPEVSYSQLMQFAELGPGLDDPAAALQVEIQIKYEGYLTRQLKEIARLKKQESLLIPENFCYDTIPSLSTEVRQRLTSTKPETIGQASRIPGVTPAAISQLLVFLKKDSLSYAS